jgi:hypothetical protein
MVDAEKPLVPRNSCESVEWSMLKYLANARKE